jgi:uncharacterized glyoxalase superfamily protein PhnB
MSYIPPGFSAVTPYLHLADAAGFLGFAQQAFGAEVVMNHREGDRIVHAEIRVAGCVLELSEARPEWPSSRACFHFYVPDCDAAHARAIAAGATESYPPTDQVYGERSGGVEDAWGNKWYFATVTDMTKRITDPSA